MTITDIETQVDESVDKPVTMADAGHASRTQPASSVCDGNFDGSCEGNGRRYAMGIAKAIFHEDADGLRDFFASVTSRDHAFKVVTPRCYDLMHALYGNDAPVEGEILCGDALLLYARDFARRYVRLGFFPSLLVVTDVLVTGRTVYDILYRMENLIYEMLREWDEPLSREITRREIHLGMLSATDIMAYAEGRPDDQIWLSYSYKLKVTRRLASYDLPYDPHDPFALELSHKINRFLMHCDDMATTSDLFVKVASEMTESIDGCGWNSLGLEYRKRHALLLSKLDNTGTSWTAYAFGTDVRGEVMDRIAGISCIGGISRRQLDMICDGLARDVLSDDLDGRLARFLSTTCPGTAVYKMELLSLVDGAETLRRLMLDVGMGWDEALEASNLGSVCQRLGTGADTGDALRRILRTPETTRRCSELLRRHGTWERNGEHAGRYDGRHGGIPVDIDVALGRCEDILCRAGMELESISCRYSRNLATFHPRSSALSQHLGDVPYGDFTLL